MRLWQDVVFLVRTMCRDPVTFLKSPPVREERLTLLFLEGRGKGWALQGSLLLKHFQDVQIHTSSLNTGH